MIPSKVKIDATTYDVEITGETLIVNGRECKGMIDFNAGLIRLSDQSGESVRKVTLMHEIVHGIICERGLDFKTDEEEMLVDEIARGFIEVMRANPELVEYIYENNITAKKIFGTTIASQSK